MLDHVSVFTKTGVVLWSRTMAKLKGTTNPVNTLIADVLLEEKGGGTRSHTIDQYTLRWRLVNELELVIVVVYQKILQLLYVDDLLEAVAREIVTRFGDGLRGNPSAGRVPRLAFDEAFDRLQRDSETRQRSQLKAEQERQRTAAKPATVGGGGDDGDTGDGEGGGDDDDGDEDADGEEGDEALDEGAKRQAALDWLSKRGGRGRGGGSPRKGAAAAGGGAADGEKKGKEGKKMTQWHDGTAKKLSKKAAGALDFSKRDLSGEAEADDEEARIEEMKETYLPDEGESAAWDEADAEVWDDDDDDAAGAALAAGDGGADAKGWFASSALGGFIATATGNKVRVLRDAGAAAAPPPLSSLGDEAEPPHPSLATRRCSRRRTSRPCSSRCASSSSRRTSRPRSPRTCARRSARRSRARSSARSRASRRPCARRSRRPCCACSRRSARPTCCAT